MDWIEIITLIISFITGGGIVGLVTLKQQKRGAKLDNDTRLVEEYTKLLDRSEEKVQAYSSKVDEMTTQLNELKRKQSIADTKIENLQLLYRNASYMRCNNLNCKRRTPPIDKEVLKELIATQDTEETENE